MRTLRAFRWLSKTGVGLTLMVGFVRPAAGQQAIRGVVLDDDTGRPVASATVRLIRDDAVQSAEVTDQAGRFEIDVPRPEVWQIEVERLGYRTARSQAVEISLGEVLDVEFRIRSEAILLSPILVTGSSRSGRTAFDRRQAEWGRGVFLSPEDLDAMELRHPGDIFRGQEKVNLRWGFGRMASGQYGVMPRVNSRLGRGCFNYMVDWVPVKLDSWNISSNPWTSYQLEGLTTDDIQAVEIYHYPGEAPPEIRRWVNSSRVLFTDRGIERQDRDLCGLVVIWTKSAW